MRQRRGADGVAAHFAFTGICAGNHSRRLTRVCARTGAMRLRRWPARRNQRYGSVLAPRGGRSIADLQSLQIEAVNRSRRCCGRSCAGCGRGRAARPARPSSAPSGLPRGRAWRHRASISNQRSTSAGSTGANGRLGKRRIGEVHSILDAGALFLGGDLALRSTHMCSKSRIIVSIEATLRACSLASKRLNRRAASRGFIVRYPQRVRTVVQAHHLKRSTTVWLTPIKQATCQASPSVRPRFGPATQAATSMRRRPPSHLPMATLYKAIKLR